jgi:hypothetical protein
MRRIDEPFLESNQLFLLGNIQEELQDGGFVLLLALKERRDERQASADRRIVDLARQAFEAEERLGRLYMAIEAGTIDGTDPSLKKRVAALNARDRAEPADYARKSSPLPVQIEPVAIDRFTRLMRLNRFTNHVRGLAGRTLIGCYGSSPRFDQPDGSTSNRAFCSLF